MQMGGSNSGSTTGSRAHSPLGSSPRKGSRAGSCHSRSHSTDTVLRHCSPGIDPVLGAAAMLGPSANANLSLGLEGFNMNLAGLGGDGMPQAPPTARSLDVGAPQPPQPPATGYNSSDFSFLSDFQPKLVSLFPDINLNMTICLISIEFSNGWLMLVIRYYIITLQT